MFVPSTKLEKNPNLKLSTTHPKYIRASLNFIYNIFEYIIGNTTFNLSKIRYTIFLFTYKDHPNTYVVCIHA